MKGAERVYMQRTRGRIGWKGGRARWEAGGAQQQAEVCERVGEDLSAKTRGSCQHSKRRAVVM